MDPAMDAACQTTYSNAYHIHCIWHMAQNKNKLSTTDYKKFICDFWKTHNLLYAEVFEERFQTLLNNFPNSNSYLHDLIYSTRYLWAYNAWNNIDLIFNELFVRTLSKNLKSIHNNNDKHFKQALNYSLDDNNQENLDILEDKNSIDELKISNGRIYDVDSIEDPVKYQENVYEEDGKDLNNSSNINRRKCGLCHKIGYYSSKCSNK
ncbi:hypothetical protein Glove_301g47 [Diversispora epigaea]|uniref:MULE transposase domain-containing protein n=1 Tax=Diversispora epigaea TaxID=1348612 RepID=A0A397HW04_9GLOM|nr:hypothetical protein Glove_301g47 [Diversispora epigaea]